MKQLEIDIPIEVSRNVYTIMIQLFAGIIAHRQEAGRYYIKRLYPGYKKETEQVLNKVINSQ